MKTIKIVEVELWGKDREIESGRFAIVENTPSGRESAFEELEFSKYDVLEKEYNAFIDGTAKDLVIINSSGDYDEPEAYFLKVVDEGESDDTFTVEN